MPTFNLPQIDDFSAIEPSYDNDQQVAAQQGGGGSKPQQKPQRRPATRAEINSRLEAGVGPLKPLAQLMNTLASPDTKAGVVVGPINAISKFGNALGDLVQGKPFAGGRGLAKADWSRIDVTDAWQIPDKAARQLNPFRVRVNVQGDPSKDLLYMDQEVTPSDQPGLALGGAIGAEILGAVTGATLIRRLGQVGRLKRAADAAKATRAVRGFAVAQRANAPLRTAVKVGKNVGEALVSTTLATPFIDVSQGNLANVGDAFGLRLPGRVDENDNYLQAFGKTLAVEGIAAPLTAIGALSFLPPARRAMFGEGVQWLDDLADAELKPYTRQWRDFRRPQLPPGPDIPQLPSAQMQAAADGSPITPVTVNVETPGGALPSTGAPGAPQLQPYQPGGAIVPAEPNGSAIERWLDETTLIRQVQEQRQRLRDAGLVKEGEGGQLELRIADGINPEVEQQIKQLQAQRGELLRQLSTQPDAAEEITKQLDEIDTQVADLTLSGTTEQFIAPQGSRQGELDLDTRPELDTVLAQLDELSDKQLRDLHSRVYREVGAERNAQELQATQQQVQQLTQRLADINARQQAGELTPRGAKGLLTKAQRELDAAQAQLRAIEQRSRVPETTVGEQLNMAMAWQAGLDLSPDIPLPPLAEVTRGASEFGYRTPEEYRAALQSWPRDLLRRLSMPDSSPEVAALVKARTGRRVWQAKKNDIIDALVEMSQRRGRYLPPEADQLELGLRTNLTGQADAPLLDVPADLSTTSRMGQTVDADGNPITVPMGEFQPRGLDPQTRERLKAEVLRRMIDNGEAQAPVTPIPARPNGPEAFNQGTFIDDLFADETGQLAMAFNNDLLPPYKAGGKNADALIDEMRLRFEFNVLDAKGQQAQKDALMEAIGWERLTWDEKKRLGYQLGIMGRGMFRFSRDDLVAAVDQVRPPTPRFKPELRVRDEAEIEGQIKWRASEGYKRLIRDRDAASTLSFAGAKTHEIEALLGSRIRQLRKSEQFEGEVYDSASGMKVRAWINATQANKALPSPERAAEIAAKLRYLAFSSEKKYAVDRYNQFADAVEAAGRIRAETAIGSGRPPQPYRGEGSAAAENVQPFTPELKPKPDRKPAVYDTAEVYASINGRPEVVSQPSAAASSGGKGGKAPPAEVKAKPKGKGKAARTPAQEQAAQRIAAREAERAQLRKDIDDLRKKFQGGSCS